MSRNLPPRRRETPWGLYLALIIIAVGVVITLVGCKPVLSGVVPTPTATHTPKVVATTPTASHAPVPANATGTCHDSTYTTAHSDAGRAEQCIGHGGAAEG